LLSEKKSRLIGSRSFWLMRPNDESRMKESNVQVCLSLVREWAQQIAAKFKKP